MISLVELYTICEAAGESRDAAWDRLKNKAGNEAHMQGDHFLEFGSGDSSLTLPKTSYKELIESDIHKDIMESIEEGTGGKMEKGGMLVFPIDTPLLLKFRNRTIRPDHIQTEILNIIFKENTLSLDVPYNGWDGIGHFDKDGFNAEIEGIIKSILESNT